MKQWNGIEYPEIILYSYSYPIFDNYPKTIVEEKVMSSASNAGKSAYLHIET